MGVNDKHFLERGMLGIQFNDFDLINHPEWGWVMTLKNGCPHCGDKIIFTEMTRVYECNCKSWELRLDIIEREALQDGND